jgi:penicillin-binding protein 1A
VFDGSVTMRQALAKSKNVPSVRLLRAIDVPYMHEYMARFGFDSARHPKNYTMALGTGLVTPLQMAGAYAVFANGGYRVTPYLIASIKDDKGNVLMQGKPTTPKLEENRAIDERNAFIMDSMMHDVTRYGTGAAAMRQLNRADIAGKTGTTNDAVDGWFAGYGGNIVAVAWMGYDEPRSLGGKEFGSTLALPFWIDYMKVALDGKPVKERTPPEGVMQFEGDWIYSEYEVEGFNKVLDMDELPPLEEPGAQPPDAARPPEPAKPAEVPPAATQ